jgi:hypothetical protein
MRRRQGRTVLPACPRFTRPTHDYLENCPPVRRRALILNGKWEPRITRINTDTEEVRRVDVFTLQVSITIGPTSSFIRVFRISRHRDSLV